MKYVLLLAGLVIDCAHAPHVPVEATVVLRVVDSSNAGHGQPLRGAQIRLTGLNATRDTIRCIDSTSNAVIRFPTLEQGRYEVNVVRVGYEGRTIAVEVRPDRFDTVVVGLRYTTRDLSERVLVRPPGTSPVTHQCT